MPVTPKEVLTDPKFSKLTPDQRRQVLIRIDPKFADLTVDQQQVVLNFKAPNVATLPPGEISSGPHGVNALKAGYYTAADKIKNLLVNNLDTAGGATGGILGGMSAGPPGALGGAALGGGAGR